MSNRKPKGSKRRTLALFLLSIVLAAGQQNDNTDPVLRVNVGREQHPLGESFVLTADDLFVDDEETTDPVEIIFTLNSGTRLGNLLLQDRVLGGGDTFTQADILEGRLSYDAPLTAETAGDSFSFSVMDFEGNVARDGDFTIFSFDIGFDNTPPNAVNGVLAAPLSGSVQSKFTASDVDLWQVLVFRIVDGGANGSTTLVDAMTGEFTYEATSGSEGTDTIQFQVNDGEADSPVVGIVEVTISETSVVVNLTSLSVPEDSSAVGSLSASESEGVTYSIQGEPRKGAVELNQETGEYTYTPEPGRFGPDAFTVVATRAGLGSEAVSVQIEIVPIPQDGDLFVVSEIEGDDTETEDPEHGIFLLHPDTGDAHQFLQSPLLKNPTSIVYDPKRKVLFALVGGGGDGDTGDVPIVSRIDPLTRQIHKVFEGAPLEFPLGIKVDTDGSLLIANGFGEDKLLRLDPEEGSIAVIETSGVPIQTPVELQRGPNGDLWVTDAIEIFEDNGRILKVDGITGETTIEFDGAPLLDPTSIVFQGNDTIIVTDRAGVLELNLQDNTSRVIVGSDRFESLIKEIVVKDDGRYYITEMQRALHLVISATGDLTTLENDFIGEPVGITEFTQPEGLSEWQSVFFDEAVLMNPDLLISDYGLLADPDGDALANFYEFATDLSPIDGSDAGSEFRDVSFGMSNGNRSVTVTVLRRLNTDALGFTYGWEATTDFETWGQAGDNVSIVRTLPAGPYFELVTYQIESTSPREFFRFSVGLGQ